MIDNEPQPAIVVPQLHDLRFAIAVHGHRQERDIDLMLLRFQKGIDSLFPFSSHRNNMHAKTPMDRG